MQRSRLVAVLLAQLCIVWTVLGVLFVLEAQAAIPYMEVEGLVCAEQCTRSCDEQLRRGCSYGGTVDLCFFINATAWLVTTAPQAACGGDCCATLLRDQTPVWIVLDDDDPPHVANFYRSADVGAAYVGGPYDNGGTALLVLSTVLGFLLCLALCVKAQSC